MIESHYGCDMDAAVVIMICGLKKLVFEIAGKVWVDFATVRQPSS